MWKTRLGFTLVELLIVIAIVGILGATTSIIAIGGNLQKARDTQRKAHLESIRSGLELYRSQEKEYPDLEFGGLLNEIGEYSTVNNDPKSEYTYFYDRITATTYVLCARMENPQNASGGNVDCDTVGDCGDGIECNYRTTQ